MRGLLASKGPRSLTGVLLALALPCSAHAADDSGPPPLKTGEYIRIEGARGAKLEGIISLASAKVATRGRLVQNDNRLVAVEVPEQEEPWCLPRPGEVVAGHLVGTDGDALVITVNGRRTPYRVPWPAIESIERNTKKPSRRRGALTGLLTGLAAGGLLGAATGCGDCFGPTRPAAALLAGTAFGAVGLAIGAAVGDGGHWEKVQKPRAMLSVGPSRRGLSLRAAIAL